MEQIKTKKGMFFILDSMIAITIFLVMIVFVNNFYFEKSSSIHLNYIAQDMISVLESMPVSEINNEYIRDLIKDGNIVNLNNSVLEQVTEFWANGDIIFANKTINNVSINLISNITGFGVWIDDEAVYNRNITISKSLVSEKRIISGYTKGNALGRTRVNPPNLYLATAEVRVWE